MGKWVIPVRPGSRVILGRSRCRSGSGPGTARRRVSGEALTLVLGLVEPQHELSDGIPRDLTLGVPIRVHVAGVNPFEALEDLPVEKLPHPPQVNVQGLLGRGLRHSAANGMPHTEAIDAQDSVDAS